MGEIDPLTAFIEAACVPLDASHASGTLDDADALLAAYPDLPDRDIHAAAILGDAARVRRFVVRDPASATATGGPRRWDPLTHLCFSRYLRLDRARSDDFVRAAAALLDAGASANTGWTEAQHQPEPEWESVLYGAAGIAHHAGLTRLLLERGADPNDNETPYHAPETYDNDALQILVESGRLSSDSLETMLLRKSDWHDAAGLTFLLEHGADPNRMARWPWTALHHAVRRDNALATVDGLLDHGADPLRRSRADGRSPAAIAARRGRGDVLASLDRRGIRVALDGVDRLLAACARNDAAPCDDLVAREPHVVEDLRRDGGTYLAEFAGNGNAGGVLRSSRPIGGGEQFTGGRDRARAASACAARSHTIRRDARARRGARRRPRSSGRRRREMRRTMAESRHAWLETQSSMTVSRHVAQASTRQDATGEKWIQTRSGASL